MRSCVRLGKCGCVVYLCLCMCGGGRSRGGRRSFACCTDIHADFSRRMLSAKAVVSAVHTWRITLASIPFEWALFPGRAAVLLMLVHNAGEILLEVEFRRRGVEQLRVRYLPFAMAARWGAASSPVRHVYGHEPEDALSSLAFCAVLSELTVATYEYDSLLPSPLFSSLSLSVHENPAFAAMNRVEWRQS